MNRYWPTNIWLPGARPVPASVGYEMGSTVEDAATDLLHVRVSVWPAVREMGASGLKDRRGGGRGWLKVARVAGGGT